MCARVARGVYVTGHFLRVGQTCFANPGPPPRTPVSSGTDATLLERVDVGEARVDAHANHSHSESTQSILPLLTRLERTTLAIWRDEMHGYNVLCLVLRHLARMELVEEIQMHPGQDYGVVFRRWGVKYGFIDFLEHFSVPQANGRARCILGNRPVERF